MKIKTGIIPSNWSTRWSWFRGHHRFILFAALGIFWVAIEWVEIK